MSSRAFLDTNVLVYADDAKAGDKCARARKLIEDCLSERTGVLSAQVLGEYFVVATRKLGVPAEIAHRKVELLAQLEVVALDGVAAIEAVKLHRLHGLSYWDALIVQAARASACTSVLSEDMQHGRRIEGVEIVNPFA